MLCRRKPIVFGIEVFFGGGGMNIGRILFVEGAGCGRQQELAVEEWFLTIHGSAT